jgi:hypothetical protein
VIARLHALTAGGTTDAPEAYLDRAAHDEHGKMCLRKFNAAFIACLPFGI